MSTTDDLGVAFDTNSDVTDAAEALLAKFMPDGDPDAPKKEPSKDESETHEKTKPEADETEETSEETPEGDEETEDEGDEGSKQPELKFAEDDHVVKVKEGDEEHEVPVKELKRLWGQEKSLTRKSQEVADLRKKTETETTRVVESYKKLLERAKAKAEPYTKINFLVASKDLSAEDLKALTEEAQARFDDVKFLEEELNGHVKKITDTQNAEQIEAGKACLKAINDPENINHIPDWSNEVYYGLRAFASKQGLSEAIFNKLTDPAAMKMIHMAQQFERGKSKVKTVKVNNQPKKIVKSSKSPVSTKPDQAKADKAMARLQKRGSVDDAAEALLARWNANSDE